MTVHAVPLKYLVGINERGLPEDTDPDRQIRYVDISSVGRGELVAKPSEMRFADAPSRARRLVKPGDTIVSTVRTYLRAVWPVSGRTDDLVVSTGFAVLTPRSVDPCYFSWWVRSDAFIEEVVARSVGVSYPAINAIELGELPVRIPRADEQQAIVDFLDTETARIDALITKKRRMIDVLEERKTATMLAAAGGVLGHSGSLESSALPWLEKRPSHWGEVLLRLVATTGSGHTPSRERPDWWQHCTIPWITTGEVAQIRSDESEVIRQTREKISEMGLANSAAVLHPRGTVVLCRTAASAGYSAIMGNDMATSQDFATWTCGPKLRPRFLLLCLRAMRPDLLGRLATGSTHKTIYMPDIHALRIPLPPLEEQDRAIELAGRSTSGIFAAMAKLRMQLGLLQQRRQGLITAAVTGKLQVPGVAA